MMLFARLQVIVLLATLAFAASDVTTPCLSGTCTFQMAQSPKSMAAVLTINGPTHAISDITPSAGWQILNCTTSTNVQNIRLVCEDESKGCGHLFQQGAENTIVRLPDSCGKGPFVRVANSSVSADQSTPPSMASKLRRRDGSTPEVLTLQIDGNFSQIPPSNGIVTFSLAGTTIPGILDNVTLPPPVSSQKFRRDLGKRQLDQSLDAILTDITIGSFNKNVSTTFPPITIDENFILLNVTETCTDGPVTVEAGIVAELDTSAELQITVGIVASGSIIPPKINELAAFASLDASLQATLNAGIAVQGTIDSGTVTLFSVGIPGLDIEDILEIGPTLSLNAEASATIELAMDLQSVLNYDVNNLQLFFPPQSGHQSSVVVSPQSSTLKLLISPDISQSADFEVHLIPTLDLGLTFAGTTEATIFLDVDVSASFLGTIEEDISSAVNVEGCLDLVGEVSINAGATGSFFGLFDASTQVALFDKQFTFFDACLAGTPEGSPASTTPIPAAHASSPLPNGTGNASRLRKRAANALSCFPSGIQSLVSMANENDLLPTK